MFAGGKIIFCLVLFFLVLLYPDAFGSDNIVETKTISFENVIIIEFIPHSDVIHAVKLWPDGDSSFRSFKTEQGWTGQKIPTGEIVFTTKEPVQIGESVKIGAKTNINNSTVNWIAIKNDGKYLDSGKIRFEEETLNAVESIETIQDSTKNPGILPNSNFKIIPEEPYLGATIRVVGEKFYPDSALSLYINNTKTESFTANEEGNFLITSKIPDDLFADRTKFVIKDDENNQKTRSFNLQSHETKTNSLKIDELPPILHQDDELKITGSAIPKGKISYSITFPNGEIMTK